MCFFPIVAADRIVREVEAGNVLSVHENRHQRVQLIRKPKIGKSDSEERSTKNSILEKGNKIRRYWSKVRR